MQRKHGSYESSEELLTPYLWASIITGLPPKEALPAVHSLVPVNPIFRWAKRNLKFLRGHGLGRFVKRRWVDKSDLSTTPIFDEVEKAVVIDFPAYNWGMALETCLKYPFRKVIGDEEKSEMLLRKILKIDEEKIRKTLEILEKGDEWDIFAVWIYCTDVVNHLFGKNRMRIMKIYKKANSFAEKIQKLLPEDCVMVIMSDHGGYKGVHRNRGFVSVNWEIELPNNLLEFYPFFKKLLKLKEISG
jgi:hypothetical protein